MWSGDIQSAFSELELQIRAVQGVVMSGQVRMEASLAVGARKMYCADDVHLPIVSD